MLNSPRYISSFQTLTTCRERQGIGIVRSQSFSRFRVIITLLKMINEPRLKIESYVTWFLFFLSSKSTLKNAIENAMFQFCFVFVVSLLLITFNLVNKAFYYIATAFWAYFSIWRGNSEVQTAFFHDYFCI